MEGRGNLFHSLCYTGSNKTLQRSMSNGQCTGQEVLYPFINFSTFYLGISSCGACMIWRKFVIFFDCVIIPYKNDEYRLIGYYTIINSVFIWYCSCNDSCRITEMV